MQTAEGIVQTLSTDPSSTIYNDVKSAGQHVVAASPHWESDATPTQLAALRMGLIMTHGWSAVRHRHIVPPVYHTYHDSSPFEVQLPAQQLLAALPAQY